ncbi:type II toxin-antitoxin system VapB family antitoxin [Intrasporangium sp. DVR]|uniref:type II toxin-antitoxin system VapB family antitoxin n=1 Tax=Intrasporangium sp. DVR TaxID=3127867 RepID=UPI00313A53EA
MSLNIKNERVHALAREAARVTGKSQTSAIEEALELLLASYGADPTRAAIGRKVDLVSRLVAEYREDPGAEAPAIRAVEDLYDEATGLPR